MYINTHQEDVFVAVSHSDRSKFAKFWTQMTNACKRLLNINVSPSPPGGFLRKRPLQMYKKIRLEMVMWIRNFLNAGCFALFLPFTRRNAVALASCKKEEGSFNFGHETGFKLQKPGHNTSAYIFFLIRELFYSSETFSFLSGSSALFEVSVFSKIITPWIHNLPLSGTRWHGEVRIAGYRYSMTSANRGKWW